MTTYGAYGEATDKPERTFSPGRSTMTVLDLLRVELFGTPSTSPTRVLIDVFPMMSSTEEIVLPISKMRGLVHDADIQKWVSIADAFASETRGRADVLDVLLDEDFRLVLVMDDVDLDRELELRVLFRRLASEAGAPGAGDLDVVTRDELDHDVVSRMRSLLHRS